MCFRFACWWKRQKEWHYSLSISRTLSSIWYRIEDNPRKRVHYTTHLVWTNRFLILLLLRCCRFLCVWCIYDFRCAIFTLIWRNAWLHNLLVIQIVLQWHHARPRIYVHPYTFAQPMRQTSFNQFQTWLHLYDAILKSFSFGFCFYYWCMNVNQLWYGKKWKSENNDGGMASMWGERGERVKESGKNQTYT